MPILELKDVRYSYSPEKVVLRGVNCVFECGTLYALVGKSGAGKSTLLSLGWTCRKAARCCLTSPPPGTWTWTNTAAGRPR